MTILHFFGDSWSAEPGEYESIASRTLTPEEFAKVESYPKMVSKFLNIPYKNHSVQGSSIAHMIPQLLNSGITSGDCAIFSLTAPSRSFYYNSSGTAIHQRAYEQLNQKTVNHFNVGWMSAWSCYTLYKLCQDQNINGWFMPLFDVPYQADYHHELWDRIPEDCWIIPKTSCVTKLFDPEYFSQWETYRNSNFHEWLATNNAQVKTYIRPCQDHPNILGRRLIADTIISKLSASCNTAAG